MLKFNQNFCLKIFWILFWNKKLLSPNFVIPHHYTENVYPSRSHYHNMAKSTIWQTISGILNPCLSPSPRCRIASSLSDNCLFCDVAPENLAPWNWTNLTYSRISKCKELQMMPFHATIQEFKKNPQMILNQQK